MRANQILVLLENGATVSARTEGTLELSIGQNAKFLVSQTTDEQIILKLFKEDTEAENPMIDKALNAANIQKTERSVSIVKELLNHQQPVNEAGIRHYLSLSSKYPELPVKDLVLMELHHIPVTKENVEQFTAYQDRNAKLLNQAQDMMQTLAKTIEQLPEGAAKQEVLRELQLLLGKESSAGITSSDISSATAANPLPEQTAVQATEPPIAGQTVADQSQIPNTGQNVSGQLPIQNAGQNAERQLPIQNSFGQSQIPNAGQESKMPTQMFPAAETEGTPPELTASGSTAPDAEQVLPDNNIANNAVPSSEQVIRSDAEPLPVQNFLDSFLLQPEDVADPEKVQKYYDELNEKLEKLEQLSQKVSEQTAEDTGTNAPKQMRQNLSFMEAVNNIFPYVQLPLKFRESPAHGELYVYEKKRALKPSDTLSALLHLEMEALGTTDIYVTLSGSHVTTRFSMTDKESGDLIRTEMPKLTSALAAKGYTLQSEVAVREPEEENTPTLLEQFLEEHAPGGLNRYTFDIRA